MSCPYNEFESRFLKALQKTDRYKIEKDIITLFSNDNAILKFQAMYYQ
jgi:heat shock protein HslJ